MNFDEALKIESEALFRARTRLQQSADGGRTWSDNPDDDVYSAVYEPKNIGRASEISSGIHLLRHTTRGDVEIIVRFTL